MTRSPASGFTTTEMHLLPDNTAVPAGCWEGCPECGSTGETRRVVAVRLVEGVRQPQFGMATCQGCGGRRVLPLETQP